MSTPIPPPAPPRPVSPSTVVLWVLGVAVAAYTPGLLAAVVWSLHQSWLTVPALAVVAAWSWRPKATKRALLTGVLLAHQTWTRRRQTETA